MKLILHTLVLSSSLVLKLLSAVPQIDTSTPKGTVKGTFDLSVAGDFDGMRKLFIAPSSDKEKELLAGGFSDDLFVPALSAACLEKFPDARVPNPVQMLERAKAEIDKMVEKIDGNTASLTPAVLPAGGLQSSGPFQQPIIFKKVDGAWKMSITENVFLRLPPPQFRASHKARCEAMEQFIQDVKAGKYASFEDFDKAMKLKMADIQMKHMPAPQSGPRGGSASVDPLDDPNLSEDDKKAAVILKAAFALLEQEMAAEAEAKILEVFPLKGKLSPKIRAQVSSTIVGLGMLDPTRATRIGPQWDKL